MKRIIFFLLLTPAILSAEAASLPESLEYFKQAALLMLDGISNNNRESLTDASELFSAINAEEMSDIEFEVSNPAALASPLVQFNSEYCDLVRKANFELVRLDPLDTMRALGTETMKVSRDIAPGAKVSFSIEGADEIAMLMVSHTPGALRYSIDTDSNGAIEVVTDREGYTSHALWNNGPQEGRITVTVENPGETQVSFAIVMQ